MPFEDDGRDLTPTHVAIHADADHLMIGASGTDSLAADSDAVGWLFMDWAP